MIRYSLEYHQQADKLAKGNGFEFAVYMGYFRSALVFIPHHNDTLQYTEGFHYISVNEKGARWHSPIIPPLGFPYNYDYLKKGRLLFEELERKVHEFNLDDPDWQNDASLYSSINGRQWGDANVPIIAKDDLYLFLQEGKRLGRKVLVKPYIERQGEIYIDTIDSEDCILQLE